MRNFLYKYKEIILNTSKPDDSLYSISMVKYRKFIVFLVKIPCWLFHRHEYTAIHEFGVGFYKRCKYCGKKEGAEKRKKIQNRDKVHFDANNVLKVVRVGVANSERSKFFSEVNNNE